MDNIRGIPMHEVMEAFEDAARDSIIEVREGFVFTDKGEWFKGYGYYFQSPDGPRGPYGTFTLTAKALIEDMLVTADQQELD